METNELKPIQQELIKTLKARFNKNMGRHKSLVWSNVEAKLISDPTGLRSLFEMERTGGDPDIVGYDPHRNEFIFYDCSPESPKGRRSLCYDREALEPRKEHRPANSAADMASEIGIELLSEEEYRELQKLGHFDKKTSSWIKTPAAIRDLGGALFADFRYGSVFVYHNSAPSYYSSRGFRGVLRV